MDESILTKLRRLRRKVFAGGTVLAIAALAWLLTHLGSGGGSGLGLSPAPGHIDLSPPQSSMPSLADTSTAVQVIVRDDQYFVAGIRQTIDQIVTSAQAARRSDSPAVKIVSEPDSRVGAERDLELALDDAHLSWALEAVPADAPQ
jgi:hypothetical protein